MSFQEKAAGNGIVLAFGAALVLVYMVLAAQYESWLLPVAVVLGVPLALAGPALVLGALGVANNLYTQIGLVLLVALAAKNAILIVEVAREERLRGAEIVAAAVTAARTRFRPIVMTSLAFGFGVLPLVLAEGAGANARRSIGHRGVHRHHQLDRPRHARGARILRRDAAAQRAACPPQARIPRRGACVPSAFPANS